VTTPQCEYDGAFDFEKTFESCADEAVLSDDEDDEGTIFDDYEEDTFIVRIPHLLCPFNRVTVLHALNVQKSVVHTLMQ
jgi:hypothetical protein